MKSLGAIQCINNKKTTSCAVVSTEENFDEIHDSRSISNSSSTVIVLYKFLDSQKQLLLHDDNPAYPDSPPCAQPRSRKTLQSHRRALG